MQHASSIPAAAPGSITTPPLAGLDFWSERYLKEGRIWGNDPSPTAHVLTSLLPSGSNVLEIGCGYGRDMVEIEEQGHSITGIEVSRVGFQMAADMIGSINTGRAHLLMGDFATASLAAGDFDAVFSHRTLHLMKDSVARAFANKAAEVLGKDGLLVVSARDPRDFNAEQMNLIAPGVAEYKSRPGHLITFWDEARFNKFFGEKFDIVEFRQESEPESQSNPVPSHFTIMVARRKADAGAPALVGK